MAGLQSGEDVRAKEYLTKATEIAPGEPAGWADLGILQVRQQQFDQAYASVDKARSLTPDNSRIEALLGLIESRRGKLAEASGHLKRAVQLDPHNLKAIYSLAEETERQPGSGSDAEAGKLLGDILQQQPQNAAVLLEDARLAAKRGDAAEVQRAIAALVPQSNGWPGPAKQQLADLQGAASSGDVRPLALRVQFLRNVLLRVPSYRASVDAVKVPATLVARPFETFLKVVTPTSQAAVPDYDTHFEGTVLPGTALWTGVLALDDLRGDEVVWADAAGLHMPGGALLPLPAGNASSALPKHAIAAADLNYDFKSEIVAATPGGFRVYQQVGAAYRDITRSLKLPAAVVNGSYTGVWPFDVDLDGDLDLVLGVETGEPVVLRNNSDGTFTQIHTFAGLNGLREFAAADIDGDGDPDVGVIDGNGAFAVFLNERLGQYRRVFNQAWTTPVADLAAADIDGDGAIDFVLLRKDGSVVRDSWSEVGSWTSAVLAQHTDAQPADLAIADVDNNGALDLIVGDQVFLGDGKTFNALSKPLGASPRGFVTSSGGLLDAVALDTSGRRVQLKNMGSKHYHWQTIRTRAAHAVGDQRINSFGIGGEIELRADLFTQKQIITSPVLHFGLGEHSAVQFARIVWPNGSVQAEFDLKADQTVLAEQRIKGSCPMLFAWDGHDMQFLKDVGPWGSALGLNVNAQGKGIYATREWFNIRGDQLVPHNGIYDLRITAEYWETYYMDHYSMLVVDHPADSEVYTDERFALPPPVPSLIATGMSRPFAKATDDNGHDVTDIVQDLDSHFLDTFGRGQYQGLTRDHWVELQLPEDAPKSGPMYLIGQAWIHDTDATIVKAQAQNSQAHPRGMSIEVPDAHARWFTVRDGLGFPKGRIKTVVLDISGIFEPGAPRKLRLRTNLELYWDKLAWAPGLQDMSRVRTQSLGLSGASLRYRGFSLITRADESSPEVPHYGIVQQSALHWQSQEGYATRYGDVLPLLQNIDDRYVITSPGDELRMQFRASAPPPAGWKRDFILICDGWVKDGDYNSTFAGTIPPLPFHAMTDYVTPPAALEDDPAYRLHPDDWRTYHTRYVTSHEFLTALKGTY